MPISLQLIIEHIDMQTDEWSQFVNRDGELFDVECRLLAIADEYGEAPEGLYEEDIDDYGIALHIIKHFNEYHPLPAKEELDEYGIMEEFSESYPDEHINDCLCIAISGKGAFRRFKDTLHRFGIAEQWYAYREKAMLDFVRNWCQQFDIPYTEE